MTERTRKLSGRRRLAFYLTILLIPVVALTAIYMAFTGYRTALLYSYIKNNERGWKGAVYRADAELGFAPIANSRGAEVFPIGDEVPARFDQSGFRVPLDEATATNGNRHPVVLALGCSFTYGAATSAERTYSHLVGEYLGGVDRN